MLAARSDWALLLITVVATGTALSHIIEDKPSSCQNKRPPQALRKFVSTAIEKSLIDMKSKVKDPELYCLFQNAFPNTLDTTIYHHVASSSSVSTIANTTIAEENYDNDDDTFIITGDITAMWLRDSTNQVLPYMRFLKEDISLQKLVRGLVNRQAASINIDAYANAYNLDASTGNTPHAFDATTKPSFLGTTVSGMNPLIFERKYELDSLAAFLKLSRTYYQSTGDKTPFLHPRWMNAITTVLGVLREMQASTIENQDSYSFQRCQDSCEPTDTLSHGVGFPGKHTGMVRSAFRPSDDACLLPFNVPANAMTVVELQHLSSVLREVHPEQVDTIQAVNELAIEIDKGIQNFGIIFEIENRTILGSYYAYEVDGYGNQYFMDDANIPSLLSLPYLGYLNASDPVYQTTRSKLFDSRFNPYFFQGSAGSGIGGPHNGLGYIWPMSIIMRALTSTNDTEIRDCLRIIKDSAASTGFLHESFWKDDLSLYTRPWFAWANALFGELIYKLIEERSHLLSLRTTVISTSS